LALDHEMSEGWIWFQIANFIVFLFGNFIIQEKLIAPWLIEPHDQ